MLVKDSIITAWKVAGTISEATGKHLKLEPKRALKAVLGLADSCSII